MEGRHPRKPHHITFPKPHHITFPKSHHCHPRNLLSGIQTILLSFLDSRFRGNDEKNRGNDLYPVILKVRLFCTSPSESPFLMSFQILSSFVAYAPQEDGGESSFIDRKNVLSNGGRPPQSLNTNKFLQGDGGLEFLQLQKYRYALSF